MPASFNPPVRVWDLPTRLFHWALVACVTGALVTIKLGGTYMDWHVRFGLATVGLVAFRLIWGLIGPRYARFATFLRGPVGVWRYLSGKTPAPVGHNPLGAWSVIAMLLVIGFQAVSGLFANDDILTQGPLAHTIDGSLSGTLTWLHSQNEWIIYGLIALHLLAILWYTLVRRKRLVTPMVTGNARASDLPERAPAAEDGPSVWLRAIVLAAAATALVLWINAQQAAMSLSF
ncbi:Nickel-dependent hydrogenase, b-type cytochrome subunit [plant metagenome]|uniref:Nickel-dependent hydrogenase, b-type cytochrome subunit n=1 Tax=plant metagenome TaxID=1297885 RepID=A0A484UPG0_9ZZZZ